MRVEELAGVVMVIDEEDGDEEMPAGHYLVIRLPDSLEQSMALMNDADAGLDMLRDAAGKDAAELAIDAAFALKLGSAGVAAHTTAEA